MQLTSGAIKALIRGAEKGDQEINAVTEDGVEWDAPQIVWEDDYMRKAMEQPEYNPVLEVTKREWLGFWSIIPTIRYTVTDSEDKEDEMVMFISHRTYKLAKSFMRKWGDGKGKLGVGSRFRLMDYTTTVEVDNHFVNHKDTPCIKVESVRCEPNSTRQTKSCLTF